MKRLAVLAVCTALAGATWAQTFAIREPMEGARIRETYNVRIPARTVPGNAYMGIYVNGKFIDAVRPEVQGADFVYPLDTRMLKEKKGIGDGPATIEAVLYIDPGEDRPSQAISRTAVNVTIDNSNSITVPESGYDIKYKYSSGRELSYGVQSETTLATVSQAQALLGSKGFEVPTEREKFRFLFAVDNVYADGDGMIRIRALPDKNRDYAFVRIASEGNTVRKVRETEMAPVYMRLNNKGREVFGAVPPSFPMEGTAGGGKILDLFLRLPFPILPTKRIKPGDVWQGAFSLGRSVNGFEADHVSDVIPGRGTFEAVEYQNGVSCARIRTTIASGAADIKNLGNLGFNQQNQSLRLDSVAWISLSGGVIIRHEIGLVQEALVDAAPVAAPGIPGAGATGGGRNNAGNRGGGRTEGGGAGAAADWISPKYDPHRDENGNWQVFRIEAQGAGQRGLPPTGPGGPQGIPGPGGFQGVPPTGPGGRFPGGVPGAQNPQQQVRPAGRQIVRVSLKAIIQLEK